MVDKRDRYNEAVADMEHYLKALERCNPTWDDSVVFQVEVYLDVNSNRMEKLHKLIDESTHNQLAWDTLHEIALCILIDDLPWPPSLKHWFIAVSDGRLVRPRSGGQTTLARDVT